MELKICICNVDCNRLVAAPSELGVQGNNRWPIQAEVHVPSRLYDRQTIAQEPATGKSQSNSIQTPQRGSLYYHALPPCSVRQGIN